MNDKTRRIEMSVYRVDGAASLDVWSICSTYVDSPSKAPPRVAKARATGAASVYLESSLLFDPNGIPHPRHTDVIGWPSDVLEKDKKHVLKAIQIKIAPHLQLEMRPKE
ncbi:MAG: hypothetical protein HC869_05655 [Rhodospirillales bacterium]|nr:hypothetical protein [Rhodospirillales bacterium]